MTTQKQPSPKKQLNNAAKYSSMAFTMAAIIVLGTLGGRWLDTHLHLLKFPLFTLVLALASVFAALWYFIRDFIKK
ncbi:MAG TPA: AtpZ/AtpI family protein [Bacteroidia bacterium]|nr:AtpZ/AtpI family protein [Bacteroidia bacterium]